MRNEGGGMRTSFKSFTAKTAKAAKERAKLYR